MSELSLPDQVYERMVVNRGLRALKKLMPAGYLACCLKVRNIDYDERDFQQGKMVLMRNVVVKSPVERLTTRA